MSDGCAPERIVKIATLPMRFGAVISSVTVAPGRSCLSLKAADSLTCPPLGVNGRVENGQPPPWHRTSTVPSGGTLEIANCCAVVELGVNAHVKEIGDLILPYLKSITLVVRGRSAECERGGQAVEAREQVLAGRVERDLHARAAPRGDRVRAAADRLDRHCGRPGVAVDLRVLGRGDGEDPPAMLAHVRGQLDRTAAHLARRAAFAGDHQRQHRAGRHRGDDRRGRRERRCHRAHRPRRGGGRRFGPGPRRRSQRDRQHRCPPHMSCCQFRSPRDRSTSIGFYARRATRSRDVCAGALPLRHGRSPARTLRRASTSGPCVSARPPRGRRGACVRRVGR